jgi:hypothetical protein
MTLLAAAVVAGTAVGAFAADGAPTTGAGTGPQIVSSSEYAKEGGVDPQSMAPIGEVAPAQGTGVEKLTDLLTKTTRLDLFQAPGVEEYEKVGQTLTFSLGDGNAEHPLNITRLTVPTHGTAEPRLCPCGPATDNVTDSAAWETANSTSHCTASRSRKPTSIPKHGATYSAAARPGTPPPHRSASSNAGFPTSSTRPCAATLTLPRSHKTASLQQLDVGASGRDLTRLHGC